jgi:hypothetical protein
MGNMLTCSDVPTCLAFIRLRHGVIPEPRFTNSVSHIITDATSTILHGPAVDPLAHYASGYGPRLAGAALRPSHGCHHSEALG